MMAHKHLHELLQEDQEPFLLKNYIADRRSQLNRPNKPIVQKSNSKHSLYKKACFFSLQDSPEVWKSPVLKFPATEPGKSPRKSPIKSPNAVLLHIPARTASLLLDAAMRVHKQSSYAKHRKTQKKNVGIGLFGSIIKRLSAKNRVEKGEIEGKSEKLKENFVALDEKSFVNSRRCSAVWSESNVDLESSSSSRSEESEEIDEYGDEERENMGFDFCEQRFCSSPFRFALQTSPSPGRRTPVFSSPAPSPIRHKKQKETCDTENIQQIHLVEEEEEEKEQFSPVSVLDPPFEEDDDGNGNGDGDDEDEDDDMECSYAIVQST